MVKKILVTIFCFLFVSIFTFAALSQMEASVVHEPPPPYEPDPDNMYDFPEGRAVPEGHEWLELPDLDYNPPPYARRLQGLRICLDPGHGGYQHKKGYKSTASGYREAVMNLKVANYLKEFLLKSGATIVMTRSGDWDLKKAYGEALAARPKVAEINDCDFLISMHHNAHSRKAANFSGAFYHAFPGYPYSNIDLGRYIVDEMEYWLRLPEFANNGLYSDYLLYDGDGFSVLRNARVPAILIEASFFSNAEEEKRLKKDEYLKREAWAYFVGICKYVRNGMPEAELVSPVDGVIEKGEEHVIKLKLNDDCPEGWGSKGKPRIVRFSIYLEINDTRVPFDYNEATGALTYRPPKPLPPGTYNVMTRYVNMHKNSNIPRVFQVNVTP